MLFYLEFISQKSGQITMIASFFIILHYFIIKTHSKLVTGTISSDNQWEFIDRFCYLSENGVLWFKFTYPIQLSAPKILIYFDDQWPSVYKNDAKTCRQKEAVVNPENNQVFYLSVTEGWTGCRKSSSQLEVVCQSIIGFKSVRERWWYVVASNCDEKLELTYILNFTNGIDPLQKNFSADEFYILEVNIAFFLAISFLFIMSIVSAVLLHEAKYLHVTFKLFIWSLFFEFLHLFILCITYGKFSQDGLDNYPAKVLGYVMEAISLLLFILLLIFMAKGLTITRGRISFSGTIKIVIFMFIYTAVYIALFIWEALAFDKGLVLYRYESFPGYCLLVMRIIAWIWFCYGIFFTLKHYPEKKLFYYPLFIFYTIWFWAGPITVIVANKGMALWLREKTANGIFLTISFLGFAFLLYITRLSKANRNFPYHVKTTQVAVMLESKASDLNPFDHLPEDGSQSSRISQTSQSMDPAFFNIFSIAGNSLPNQGGKHSNETTINSPKKM